MNEHAAPGETGGILSIPFQTLPGLLCVMRKEWKSHEIMKRHNSLIIFCEMV